jgi:hypothetical protein
MLLWRHCALPPPKLDRRALEFPRLLPRRLHRGADARARFSIDFMVEPDPCRPGERDRPSAWSRRQNNERPATMSRKLDQVLSDMTTNDRVAMAKQKTERVVDHLLYLLRLNANNEIVSTHPPCHRKSRHRTRPTHSMSLSSPLGGLRSYVYARFGIVRKLTKRTSPSSSSLSTTPPSSRRLWKKRALIGDKKVGSFSFPSAQEFAS